MFILKLLLVNEVVVYTTWLCCQTQFKPLLQSCKSVFFHCFRGYNTIPTTTTTTTTTTSTTTTVSQCVYVCMFQCAPHHKVSSYIHMYMHITHVSCIPFLSRCQYNLLSHFHAWVVEVIIGARVITAGMCIP